MTYAFMMDENSNIECDETGLCHLDVSTCVLGLALSIGSKVNTTGAAAYRRWHEISISEIRLLVAIGNAPGITGARIHDALGLDMGTISRTLRRIEGQGLVQSRRDPRHPSYRRWHLTEAGVALHNRASALIKARKSVLLDGFSKAETAQLQSFLQRLDANARKLDQITEIGVEGAEQAGL